MDGAADRDFVAFDLETTGLSPESDRIIEVGAVRFARTGQIVATFEQLVNPNRRSGDAARSVHGIADEELARAEGAEVVLPRFLSFLGDPPPTALLAHHAAFDAGILGRELVRLGMPFPDHRVVDTLAWSRRRWPTIGSHRLDSLAKRFGCDEGRSHRALADSRRVRGVFLALAGAEMAVDDHPPLAYPIYDGAGPDPTPCGWGGMAEAIASERSVVIEYLGGSRGQAPREISPRSFTHRGGVAYLVAWCHIDRKLKDFQVDRVRRFAVAGGEWMGSSFPGGDDAWWQVRPWTR